MDWKCMEKENAVEIEMERWQGEGRYEGTRRDVKSKQTKKKRRKFVARARQLSNINVKKCIYWQ